MRKCLIAAQKVRHDVQLVCDFKLIGFDGGRNVFFGTDRGCFYENSESEIRLYLRVDYHVVSESVEYVN